MRNTFFRFISLITSTLLVSTIALAQLRLPHQPLDPNGGGYVVLWDCANDDFAAANTMEFNETFVFAVNLAGTPLGEWAVQQATRSYCVRGVCADLFTETQNAGDEIEGIAQRLWHIRDTIFGATYNFQQYWGQRYNWANGTRTPMHIRLFGFESPLYPRCGGSIETGSGDWWVWPNGWTSGSFVQAPGANYFFRFAPYSNKPNNNNIVNGNNDIMSNRYTDNGSLVREKNGYSSPWSPQSGDCYMPYDDDIQNFALTSTSRSFCKLRNQKANVQLAGSETGRTYELYKDGQPTGQTIAGTGDSSQKPRWTIEEEGIYTVYAWKNSSPNVKVKMIPCSGESEISITADDGCCEVKNLTVKTESTEIHPKDEVTFTANWTSGDGLNKRIEWWCNGTEMTDWTELSPSPNDSSVITIKAGDATTNNGYYTYVCKVFSGTCDANAQKQIHVLPQAVCPEYTWTIDGNLGVSTPMYPGGWYEVTCTCEAGAPTVAITGTGVTTQGQTVNGNTVTLRVELSGSATGEMQFAAKNNANTALDFKACGDTLRTVIAECEGMTKSSYRIQWSNFEGCNDCGSYKIHNGDPVFLRDDNGYLEANIAQNDGMDEWNIIYTGTKYNGQDSVFYIQNDATKRYLHRGTQHGNQNQQWEYTEALMSPTNAQTDDYKWVFYHYTETTGTGNVQRTILACLAGYQGTEQNIKNGAFVIHNRNWEWAGGFQSPNIPTPHLACGKTAGEAYASPVFRLRNFIKTQVAASGVAASLAWNGTVSSDTIVVRTGDKFTYTAHRSDNVHSLNEAIHYESSNPTGFEVNAITGAVDVKSKTPSDTATIFAILESVGCFAGDTIRYALRLHDCSRDIATHEDYRLPHQPQTEDCEYIVLWDCNANDGKGDWAEANTMEWGETFTFAINLAGTPLGNWVMQQPSTPGAVRTIAFDRLLKKSGDDQSEHFALDVSRLWLIRDTIFGATYNFKQIPLVNGQFYTPKTNEQTGIAVRLFGVEAAHGDKCGNTPSVSKWWQWSNYGPYSEWNGQWQEGKYVSGDDQYLFRFAPYTGKSDPVYNAQVDDVRDRWYDNGHDFSNNGYCSPCAKPWPQDQAVTIDKQIICVKDQETATLTLAGSEIGWDYTLYNNTTAIDTLTGTGSALTWTLTTNGSYTVQATATAGGHDDLMGSCTTQGVRMLGDYCEPDPECDETQYESLTDYVCDTLLPYTWQTYRTVTITKADLTADGIYHDTLFTTLSNGEKCEAIIYKLVLRVDICEPLPVEPEERVTEPDAVCAGDKVTLVADSLGHKYLWSTGATTDRIQVTPTTPGTEEYTVRVYDTRRQTSANLMANGDFENYTDYHQAPAGFTSDYEYLPFSPTATDLYNVFKDKNGVYLLSANAKNTWSNYANVSPHGGDYFAMFDAAQSGAAWRVTTLDNPHMTLRQGAKYIFSYWAADLNEPNQRQNPAELQFSINYKNDANGQMTKEYLGQKMTLGKDNKWHYYEVVWTAPCNASYLEISVEDLNNVAGVGNDFGLDDIVFQMINGEAEYTVDKQRFVLTVEDCTEPEPCQEVAYRKWNDLIFVDNSGNEYISYQWFADGQPIPGATAQYYYSENIPLAGDGHRYHCEMMTVGGKVVTTCDHLFDEFVPSVSVKNSVAPISCTVFTVGGALIRWGADRSIVNDLPAGYYLIRTLMTDGTVLTEKHVIR